MNSGWLCWGGCCVQGMVRRGFKGLLLRMRVSHNHLRHLSQSTSCSLNDFAQLPPCKYHFRVSVSVNRSNWNLDIINYNKKFLAFVYPVKCHKILCISKQVCLSTWGKNGNSLHAFFFKGKKVWCISVPAIFHIGKNSYKMKKIFILCRCLSCCI